MDYVSPEQAILSRVSGVSGTVTCSRGASKTLAAPGPSFPPPPPGPAPAATASISSRSDRTQPRPPGVQAPAAARASRGTHSRPRLPLREAHVPILGSGASCAFQEGGLWTGRQPGWERGWRWRNRSCQAAGRESGGNGCSWILPCPAGPSGAKLTVEQALARPYRIIPGGSREGEGGMDEAQSRLWLRGTRGTAREASEVGEPQPTGVPTLVVSPSRALAMPRMQRCSCLLVPQLATHLETAVHLGLQGGL